MNRPLVWIAAALAAGIGAASFGAASSMPLVLLLAAAGLILSFIPWRSYYLQPAGLFMIFMAAGALSYAARHTGPGGDPLSRALHSHADALWTVEGRIRSVQLWRSADRTQEFVLEVERVRVAGMETAMSGRVCVWWSHATAPVYTDERVRVTGKLSLRLGEVNPRVQGYEDYLRRRGVHSRMRADGAALERLQDPRPWRPGYWTSRLRQAQAALLARAVPEKTLPFVLSVWLGESCRSSDDSYRAYVDSGTAHILSVSGLHIAIVYMSATLLLRLLIRDERLRTVFILVAVWTFALAAGAAVGCIRSAKMVSLHAAAGLFKREPDSASSLSFSAIVFLLVNPDLLFDAGFQLSFLSVASMLLYADALAERMERLPRSLRDSVAASVSSQLLSLPSAVHTFHVLPLAAPLANLAVVPLLAATLWLAFMTVMSGLLPWDFSSIFGHALVPAVYTIRSVAAGVSSVHGTRLVLNSPTTLAVVAYAGAAWALWAYLKVRKPRHGYTALGLALAVVLLWRPMHRPAEVVFLDVGAGDAAFLCTGGGATVLIDGGDNFDREGRERVVLPFLHSNRVARLDCVVATHSDRDHLAGVYAAVEAFPVGVALLPVNDAPDDAEQAFLGLCAKRGVPVRRLARGDTVNLAGARLEALYPSSGGGPGEKPNNRSLVLRLKWTGPSVLFAGDIEAEAEAEVAANDCRADILKVPHHGSDTSSTDPFIAAVAPKTCVVSTGALRGRELARADVLARYRAHNVEVWRTDRVGGVRLERTGKGYRLKGERLVRGYPAFP